MDINQLIKQLVQYGLNTGLIRPFDEIYTTNLLLARFGLDDYTDPDMGESMALCDILSQMCDYAVEKGIIEDGIVSRDLFDTSVMNLLMPRPSDVIDEFDKLYEKSPEAATEYYYKLSCDSNYIRRDRIAKDKKWVTSTEYGDLDITINLSKPEKDPKAIAAALTMKQSAYPKCQLCKENEGYAGRVNHPARQNHRIIPISINGGRWGFQYSPYVYYNEHCIVFNGEHTPMKIDRAAFCKLFDFVKLFPHYFIGSNADLPIVGGSILTHDHFQGGHYTFAMAKAPIETPVVFKGFETVEAGILKWPMSVIRTRAKDTDVLIELGEKILKAWRAYTDEEAFIFAETDGVPHNTITPIARKNGDMYELDLVLRNNITTDEYPDGVYHPHKELHNIKKENIGLIEVMGLAVLPARLKNEMEEVKKCLISGGNAHEIESIEKHADWIDSFRGSYGVIDESNAEDIIHDEIGKVFAKVLEHAGVYKRNDSGKQAFMRFIDSVNK